MSDGVRLMVCHVGVALFPHPLVATHDPDYAMLSCNLL